MITPEELQDIERILTSTARYHAEHARHGGITREFHAAAADGAKRAAEALPHLTATIAALAAGIEAADLRALQAEEALAKAKENGR